MKNTALNYVSSIDRNIAKEQERLIEAYDTYEKLICIMRRRRYLRLIPTIHKILLNKFDSLVALKIIVFCKS